MDYFDVINKRYSVRAYKNTPIEEEKLILILEAARLAPTASNRQPFRIIIAHTQGKEVELQSIYPRNWFTQAPIVICVCGIPSEAWVRKDQKCYLDVDGAIVMNHIILTATALDLGTCFVAAFDIMNARKILQLPDDVEPLLFTPLGYPADFPKPRERKALNEIVRYEHW